MDAVTSPLDNVDTVPLIEFETYEESLDCPEHLDWREARARSGEHSNIER